MTSPAVQTPAPDVAPTRRLHLPAQVRPIRVLWSYAIPIAVVHLLALAAAWPWLFSWTGLVLCALGVFVYGQAINLYYHRMLTHRSFRVPPWLERLFAIMALCCLQATPARWVAVHRLHHQYSDQQPDPHSPLAAFFWSHVGWLLVRNPQINAGLYQKYAVDLLRDPFYMALEKHPQRAFYVYVAHAALYFGAGAGFVLLRGGASLEALQFGLSLLLWGVIVRTVLVWHITWSVNSLTHRFGYRNHDTQDDSRNNWLVALLAVGEGWHNNHHADPASASLRQRWWELDITYAVIRTLELLGLAKDVVRPRQQRRSKSRDAADGQR